MKPDRPITRMTWVLLRLRPKRNMKATVSRPPMTSPAHRTTERRSSAAASRPRRASST
ncbi:type VII secretion protein EccE [Streptomyces sp. NPDC059749]|uniref:type VII secretion protein EccE n=1 Tax=unclassified Streptomyces TaxID=2593676 RepID=UPI00362EE1C3